MISLTFAYQTITVFSEFDPIITLGLSLLIPTIIVESLILTNYSKKSWWKLFIFCVIISFIASLAAILVSALFGQSPHVIAVLLCWVALLIIIILVENRICKKYWEVDQKKKLLQPLIIINVIAYFIFTVSISLIISSCVKGERINRIRCTNNLKQIGMGLTMYAEDNKGYLPNRSGIAGLEQLRGDGYSNYNSFYQCPSCNPLKVCEQKLYKEIVDYIYRSGLKISDDKDIDYSKIPVVWDKPINHEDFGNVLFLDGHAKGFKGKDWMEQAGIKKTAQTIMTKYKHFNMAEENDNITIKGHSNKIIAIIDNTQLDSESVFGEVSKIISKSQKEWEEEWGQTHEILRIKHQKWKYIYVSTINDVSQEKLKEKIDELDKDMFEIIIVKLDVDINISKVRSFIHNVGKANLNIAFWHTNAAKGNDDKILYWDGK